MGIKFFAVAVLAAAVVASDAFGQAQMQSPAVASSEVQEQVSGMQDPIALQRLAKQFETDQKWAEAAIAWRRLSSLSPHNPAYLYNQSVNFALANDKAQAYHILLTSQRAGLGFKLGDEPRFANLHGTEVWDYLIKLHASALDEPFGEGEVAFEIAPADRLLESVAYDPVSKSILLGSARDGVIYRRGSDGKLEEWSRPQGDSWWSIFDIKVDAARQFVWATTSAIPHFSSYKPEMAGRAALLKLDLKTGDLIEAYPPPDDGLPHLLNSIAISSKGMVVVSDGMRAQLFKFENDELVPLMAERRLNSLRGMTFSADGGILYFADYERGLFGLDLARGSAFDVGYPKDVNLYGIEGLYLYENQLVAIQNGLRPQRIMRFKLSDDGHRVEMGVPLDSAKEAFATPTLGALVGDDLLFIANSQRGYYDGFGLLKGARPLPPTRIFRSDVRFNWDFKPPSLPASLAPTPPSG
jgi:hypothetical protein